MRDMPYFMNNESWFYFDFDERIWKITDKAPEEAKKSYEEYLREINGRNRNS